MTSHAPPAMGLDTPSGLRHRRLDVPPGLWAAAAVAAALGASYAQPIRRLVELWYAEPSYSTASSCCRSRP